MFIPREDPFTCGRCSQTVEPLGKGTYRNHCPFCLWSKHVDDAGPGDRASSCGNLMEPTGIDSDSKKGFVLIHRCTACGKVSRNKAAPDDHLDSFSTGIPH